MVCGDIDGSGRDDVVIDFGATLGIWAYCSNSSWDKLNSASPEFMVCGNVDGNLKEDIVVDFGSYGIYIYR